MSNRQIDGNYEDGDRILIWVASSSQSPPVFWKIRGLPTHTKKKLKITKKKHLMKLDFVAPTCPTEGIFVDPRIWISRSHPSRVEMKMKSLKFFKLTSDFRLPSWIPFCTSRGKNRPPQKKNNESLFGNTKHYFRLQPLEEKKGWVPRKSDIIIILTLNSHSKLFLKWFVKIMIDFFKQKSLQVTRVPKIARSSFRLSWRIGAFTISEAGIRTIATWNINLYI